MGRIVIREAPHARIALVVERLADAAAESVDLGIVVSGRALRPRDFHALLDGLRGIVRLSALDPNGPGPFLAKPGVLSHGVVAALDDPLRVPSVFHRIASACTARIHLVPATRVGELVESRNQQDLQVRSSDEPASLEYGASRQASDPILGLFDLDVAEDRGGEWGECFHFGRDCPDPLRRLVTD